MALVLVPLAACGDPDRSGLDALERRLADLDTRLSAVEKALPATQSLRDDIRALEQRLASAEAKAVQALAITKAAPAPSAPPVVSPGGPAAPRQAEPADATQRREQLNDLSTEYYRKRAEMATQTQNASRLEQSIARRELRKWFSTRRRAILRGEPLPD